MSNSEKFCLKWNEFQQNITSSFASLRDDTDFTDVTLACDDGQQVEAHKVILVASSPFFLNLLKRNKHVHPLIYMRGMNSEVLAAIIDFLYHGEAKIYQDNLDSFLAIAEEIKLKGLSGGTSDLEINEFNLNLGNLEEEHFTKEINIPRKETDSSQAMSTNKYRTDYSNLNYPVEKVNNEISVLFRNENVSCGLEELDKKIKSIMDSKHIDGHLIYVCKICGKEAIARNSTVLKNHIEAKHLNGISVPCNFCDKICRS